MIRMIANNTSDYVATDLIHNLWCKHAENYDQLFPNDPHNIPDVPCVFEHHKKPTKHSNDDGGGGGGGGDDGKNGGSSDHKQQKAQQQQQVPQTTYWANPADVYNKLVNDSTDSITLKNRAPSIAHANVMHRLQARAVVESENEDEDSGPSGKFKPSQTKV